MLSLQSPNPLSANLRRLRTAAGLSQEALAAEVQLSRGGYLNIEQGKSIPREDTVVALARALRVAPGKLYAPVPRPLNVRFRADKRLKNHDALVFDISRQLAHYNQLERTLEHLGALKRSDGFARARKSTREQLVRSNPLLAARLARTAFGLKDSEVIRDICGLLEDNGIKVLTPSVAAAGFFGLSVGEGQGGPAIAVNTWDRISVERWIFTAAHELGHLLMHADSYEAPQSRADAPAYLAEECAADLFAAHFLMPDAVFFREFEQASGLSLYDRVFKMKRLFRVSYLTVLHRVVQGSELVRVPGQDVRVQFDVEYKQRHGKLPKRTVEPDPLTRAAVLPRPADKVADEPEHLDRHDFMQDRLARLVRMALEHGEITVGKGAEVLALDALEMRALVSSWTSSVAVPA